VFWYRNIQLMGWRMTIFSFSGNILCAMVLIGAGVSDKLVIRVVRENPLSFRLLPLLRIPAVKALARLHLYVLFGVDCIGSQWVMAIGSQWVVASGRRTSQRTGEFLVAFDVDSGEDLHLLQIGLFGVDFVSVLVRVQQKRFLLAEGRSGAAPVTWRASAVTGPVRW
jgi:hypothetical protein